MVESTAITTFAYEAQAEDGEAFNGTLDAVDADEARWKLQALGLRVVRMAPAEDEGAARRRTAALRGDDFLAFNEQLAQLTAAGLPVEQGLRLIARDLRRGSLRRSVQAVADELDRGTPLEQAFEKHASNFPPLYGMLIKVGVETGNLSGALLNLGRHMQLVARLRETLWRAAAYPLMVLIGMVAVVSFIGLWVVPEYQPIFHDMDVLLPPPTELLMSLVQWLPATLIALGVLAIGAVVGWSALWGSGWHGWLIDRVILRLPLIGAILRRSVTARWCDAAGLAVSAGIDLPRAMTLAGDAVGLGSVGRDSASMARAIESGASIGESAALRVLPPSVAATIDLASHRGDLPEALRMLATMHERQAEARLATVSAVLQPLFILVLAFIMGFVILALFLPLISLIQNVA